MNDQLIPAEFHGTTLNIIDHEGQKWLTAEQAGICLGYDQANARNRVTKIYERHSDEFTEQDTIAVKLTANSRGNPTTRIFSATGCIKLGFFASTPRARDFRTWASKVLAGQQSIAPVEPSANLALAQEIGALKDTVAAQHQAIMGLYEKLDGARRGHLRALTSLSRIQQRQAKREAKELVLLLESKGVDRDEIVRRTGMTHNHVRQIVWQAKRDGKMPQEGGVQ